MAYQESTVKFGSSIVGTRIEMTCDARKGKGICGNYASITMPT